LAEVYSNNNAGGLDEAAATLDVLQTVILSVHLLYEADRFVDLVK
jgi:hypothetical protein